MYDNNAQGGQSTVPAQSTEANPVLEALGGALKQQQEAVNKAAELVNKTPPYTNSSSSQPAIPVPKPSLFGNASEKNVQNQQPQTRAGARNKAIGQIAGQAGSIVGAYMKKKENEKTQALAIDIHKSLELQQGMDEAKQVLSQDPNNAQAKATLQKNQTLMTALLNGKSGKDIAKAYGVTFGPEAKDMSPDKQKDSMHHQAMQQAMKQADQDKRMKEFEAQTPSRMGANPAYQAAQAQYTQAAKTAEAATKVYTQFASKVYGEQSSTDRATAANTSRETVAAGRDKATVESAETRAKAEIDTERLRAQTEIQKAGIAAKAHLDGIKIMKQSGDNEKAIKMSEDAWKATDSAITKVDSQIDDLNKKNSDPKIEDDAKKLNQARIKDLGDYRKQLSQQKDQFYMEMHSDPDAAAMYKLLNMDDM